MGEVPVLVGSCLCHRPQQSLSSYFIVNGQCKVIVSQERLLVTEHLLCIPSICHQNERLANNQPLVSVCTLQSRHTQYNCEVRSVPINNPHRYPVVFTVRITQSIEVPHCAPRMPPRHTHCQ